MDARKERIGEHAAASSLPWAVSTLGPVPADPVTRLEWRRRAASVGAYRELSGYDYPADPIGPEPATGPRSCAPPGTRPWPPSVPSPSQTCAACRTGCCFTYATLTPPKTAWAPPWTGDELRQARTGARDARLTAIRATAEAATARRQGEHEQAIRQQVLAASYQAMHDAYRERETVLATAMADRADWEQATRQQRQLAVAADAELRRRHPAQPWPRLRSAEPEPAAQIQRDRQVLIPGADIEAMTQQARDLVARHREFADKLAERQSLMIPAEDPDLEDLGPAFPAWAEPGSDAILQPPKPDIQPSERTLERTASRDLNMEAAD